MEEQQTLTIGGKEYPVRLRYVDYDRIENLQRHYYRKGIIEFRKTYGRIPNLDKEKGPVDKIPFANDFFFITLWILLIKKGRWPFTKPYRSKKAMIEDLDVKDIIGVSEYINKEIFNLKSKLPEDKEQKNEM